MKLCLSLFAFFVLVSFHVSGQTFNKAKMDSLFTILEEKNKAMGTISITKDGKLVYQRSIGYASINEQEKIKASAATKYRIGSITKTFTAVIIFQLIEEKKLSLTDNLYTFFPSLPNADKITIDNMLSHRSGLHNFTDDSLYATYYTKPITQKKLLDIIAVTTPDFEPGKKTQYSNTNYTLLAFIAEKITGKTYSQLLTERITKKLSLTDTYAGGKTSISNNECYSYSRINNWLQEPETDLSVSIGAGNVVSTANNLVTFIEALFNGKLVSDSSLANMKKIREGMGMGMFRIPFYDRFAYGHNGSIDGFGSTYAYFPKDSVAVSYCTNGMVYPMNDILIGILSIYFNRKYELPAFNTIALTETELDSYTGTYSSKDFPLAITISKDGAVLMAQATGQSQFPLEYEGNAVFKFDPAGIIIKFDTGKKSFALKQAGREYLFTIDN